MESVFANGGCCGRGEVDRVFMYFDSVIHRCTIDPVPSHEEGFAPVRAERREIRELFRRRPPLVELPLLLLGRLPDAPLGLGVHHDDELPGLTVRARGSGRSRLDRGVHDVQRHGGRIWEDLGSGLRIGG